MIEPTATVDQRSSGRHGPPRRWRHAAVGALLASALVVAGAPLGGAEDGPASLTVSPLSGLAGDQLTVSGQGCEADPDDGSVRLAFHPFGRFAPGSGVAFAHDVDLEDDGTFQGTVTIPQLPPGTYPVWVYCFTYPEGDAAWELVVLTDDPISLTVEVPTSPAAADLPLALSPSPVEPGATVTASASAASDAALAQDQVDGFVRHQPVQVVLYRPEPVLLGTTTTGPGTAGQMLLSGAPLSLDVAIPADTPLGIHQVVAYGAHTGDFWWGDYHAGVVAGGPVTVGTQAVPDDDGTGEGDETPAGDDPVFEIPATPPEADGVLVIDIDGPIAPGSEVGISGEGFDPGEQIAIILYSEPVLLDTVTADDQGRLQARVTIPLDTAPGPHTLVAIGMTSGHVLSVAIEVAGPEPAAPAAEQARAILPVTGSGPGALSWLALLLLATGAALVTASLLWPGARPGGRSLSAPG